MKLINPLKDGSAYLYHYTTCDTALNFILKNKTLQLNPFRKVNDPRESKSWDISPFVRDGLNLKPDQYDAISEEVSEILKANAKLLCFSRDKQSAVRVWQPKALLNRGFAKPSMWQHYAGKHDGVCLMFNREKLDEAFEKQVTKKHLYQGNVKYSDSGILPNLKGDPFMINLVTVRDRSSYFSAVQAHFVRWNNQLFFQKLQDWSNEDEYRWVLFDKHSQPRYLCFEDALEAVVVGENVQEEKYEQFLKHCANNSAEIAHLKWHNGFPKIEHPVSAIFCQQGLSK